jgi:hypothetical protein
MAERHAGQQEGCRECGDPEPYRVLPRAAKKSVAKVVIAAKPKLLKASPIPGSETAAATAARAILFIAELCGSEL